MKPFKNKEVPTKWIASIEFRYVDEGNEYQGHGRTISATIGVFDNVEDATKAGNAAIEQAGDDFVTSINKAGHIERRRLDHRGNYGKLIRQWHRKRRGIEYYAKVEPLRFYDVGEVVAETIAAHYRYSTKREDDAE